MALNRISCPECGAGLKSQAGFKDGQSVSCPKCSHDFTVEEPAADFEVIEEDEPPVKAKVSSKSSEVKATPAKKTVKAAVVSDDDDDEDEARPKKKKKKKKPRDEDDDDSAGSYKNSPLRFIILGVLIIIMLVLAFFLWQKYKKEHEDTKEPTNKDTETTETTPKLPKPMGGLPKGPNFGPGKGKQQTVPAGLTQPTNTPPVTGGTPPTTTPGGQKPPVVSAEEGNAAKALKAMGADLVRDSTGHVIVIELRDKNMAEEIIPHLQQVPQLFSLDLSLNPITDVVLERTQGSWPKLGELELVRTKVTDKGIGVLAKSSPKLQSLGLTGNSGITDVAMANIEKLPLQKLHISGTKVSDAGLASVKKLKSLEELYCGNKAVTDKGLAELKELKQLKTLTLADSQVTDQGLASLAGLTNLEFLVLDRTKVTDVGLAQLKGLKNLQRLRVADTGVTAEGEAALKQAIPGITIEREKGLDY